MANDNLFGDSDSSDESVGAAPAPSQNSADGGPPAPAPSGEGAPEKIDGAASDGAENKGDDGGQGAAPSTAGRNSNSALFGDEDSSSDDGEDAEFKGDDVKGTSGGADKATEKAAEEKREADAGKTMSQRHGEFYVARRDASGHLFRHYIER